jgi:NAD(P)-dependent dehydrogenase (short-subunit alcohol dehydrogenase family)
VQRFEGKVAVVTGAASGIGRATVERLVAEGAQVVAVDLGAMDDIVALDGGDRVVPLPGDVSDPATGPAAVAAAVDRFGRLDVLANVAGILRTANTHEHPLEVWDQVLAVNLTGTFLCCRAALPVMLEHGGGAIVNTSSTAALAGHPWAAAYSASKGGVLALTKVLAVEYAKRGIRANAVCPGSIRTPITGDFEFPEGADAKLVHRIMSITEPQGPEVVAAAIAYLASDDARHVNGESLRVDGGTLS